MATSQNMSHPSQAQQSLQLLHDQFETDPFVPDAHAELAKRAAEAVETQDPLMRDSMTNPNVLKYRTELALEGMRLQKLWYKEQMSKLVFLEHLRDGVKITHEDNKALLAESQSLKSELKGTKAELENEFMLISDSCDHVGQTYQAVKRQLEEGTAIIEKIKETKWELGLRRSEGPEKRMTIDELTSVLATRDETIVELMESEGVLTQTAVKLRSAIAQLTSKLETLSNVDLPKVEKKAREVQETDLEKKGEIVKLCSARRGMIELYFRLAGVHPLVAASENELRIPFADVDADPHLLPDGPTSSSKVMLALIFNPANRRLAAAHLIGSDMEIEELLTLAIDSNDVPTFIRDVRHLLLVHASNPEHFQRDEIMEE